MSRYLEMKKQALLMSGSPWWLPSGISDLDCIAAYKFKGAKNEAEALSDITNHGNTLTKVSSNWRYVEATAHFNTPSWDATNGFNLGDWCGLDNTTVRRADPVSIIASYNFDPKPHMPDDFEAAVIYESYETAHPYRRLYLSTAYTTHAYYKVGSGSLGYQYNDSNGSVKCMTVSATDTNPSASMIKKSGVIGITFNGNSAPALYYNGVAQTVNSPTFRKGAAGWEGEPASVVVTGYPGRMGVLLGMREFTSSDDYYYNDEVLAWNCAANWGWVRYSIQAIAYYSVPLTAEQHLLAKEAINMM